jgi:HEAT repeat protein
LSQWKYQLSDRDPSRRTEAILALPFFGEAAADCVPLLLGRMQDGDLSPRVKAVMILRMMAIRPADVPKVVKGLADRTNPIKEQQTIVRYEAVRSLARFAPDASAAIPALVLATKDKGAWEVRQAAVLVLARAGARSSAGGPDPRATYALIAALRDDNTHFVRLEAVQALGSMGRPSEQRVLRDLTAALNLQASTGTSTTGRVLAIWSLAALVNLYSDKLDNRETEVHLKKIGAFLKSPTLELRVTAATALAALGPKARSQVPALLGLLRDREPSAVSAACVALAVSGDNSDRVVTPLTELLAHDDPNCVVSACGALMQMKAGGPRVLAALQRQLDRTDEKADKLKPYLRHTIDQLKKPVK